MEFNKKDMEVLLKIYGGEKEILEQDIEQLMKSADVTTYTFGKDKFGNDERRITRLGAIRKLGRAKWLSGLARSAFHVTALRYVDDADDKKGFVWFNSKRLFN